LQRHTNFSIWKFTKSGYLGSKHQTESGTGFPETTLLSGSQGSQASVLSHSSDILAISPLLLGIPSSDFTTTGNSVYPDKGKTGFHITPVIHSPTTDFKMMVPKIENTTETKKIRITSL
jgi:hypothetical protein